MKTTLTAIATLALAGTAMAGTTGYSSKSSKVAPAPAPAPAGCDCFAAGTTSLDFFAAYGVSGNDHIDGEFGGGLRLNSFFSEYFGVSASWAVIGDAPIHDVAVSFVARYPITDACLAPYVFAGPGGYFNSSNELTGHVGVGLDVRLFGCSGLFVEYKHTFAGGEVDDYGLLGAGYRWAF